MNIVEMEKRMLQSMIQQQCIREIKGGGTWPGKDVNASVETRYPNIVAEMGWGLPWLRLSAEFADVSEEVMAAVLEDNEELSAPELWRLSRYLNVSPGYLNAPRLSMIDPATNKGKACCRTLADMFQRAGGLDFWRWRVEAVGDDLNSGTPVPYARWRWAVGELKDAFARQQRAQHKPRRVRRATA